MKHFKSVRAPAAFIADAPTHAAWLEDHPHAKRPRDYWSEHKPTLAAGFLNLCAYTVMYCPDGTVDHFVSWKEDRSKAYEWSNYRFAAGGINCSKQNLDSSQTLDPFCVGDDWFEIILPSLQLVTTKAVPEGMRERANTMLTRLHLRDDERVIRVRRRWYKLYQDGNLTLEGLRENAPLIAAAVERGAAPSTPGC